MLRFFDYFNGVNEWVNSDGWKYANYFGACFQIQYLFYNPSFFRYAGFFGGAFISLLLKNFIICVVSLDYNCSIRVYPIIVKMHKIEYSGICEV